MHRILKTFALFYVFISILVLGCGGRKDSEIRTIRHFKWDEKDLHALICSSLEIDILVIVC